MVWPPKRTLTESEREHYVEPPIILPPKFWRRKVTGKKKIFVCIWNLYAKKVIFVNVLLNFVKYINIFLIFVHAIHKKKISPIFHFDRVNKDALKSYSLLITLDLIPYGLIRFDTIYYYLCNSIWFDPQLRSWHLVHWLHFIHIAGWQTPLWNPNIERNIQEDSG